MVEISQYGSGEGSGRVTSRPTLQLLIHSEPPQRLALLRAIELLSCELAVPAQYGIGLENSGHLRQGLLTQLCANLS